MVQQFLCGCFLVHYSAVSDHSSHFTLSSKIQMQSVLLIITITLTELTNLKCSIDKLGIKKNFSLWRRSSFIIILQHSLLDAAFLYTIFHQHIQVLPVIRCNSHCQHNIHRQILLHYIVFRLSH